MKNTNNTTQLKARLTGGNIKLGNMATFNKLYGDSEYNTPYGVVNGSCGKHCNGCKLSCYVRKSYRYPSVVKGHARNTQALRNDLQKAFSDIDNQLSHKRNPWDVVRIHQSGEIETATELLNWLLIARKHPESRFYLYTKNFDAVKTAINSDFEIPNNITILLSIWHEYGIKEYNALKDYPFIKAFAYCDGFDYSAHGIQINTMCNAYDDNGKLNHELTCDKCKKCFNSPFKVIGCNDH